MRSTSSLIRHPHPLRLRAARCRVAEICVQAQKMTHTTECSAPTNNLPIRPATDNDNDNISGTHTAVSLKMTVANIVSDPSLQPILSTASQTLTQCLSLADFIESQPLSSSLSNDQPSEETLLSLSKRQKLLFALLAHLRGQNRTAILGVRNTKQSTAEARQEIDRLHLQLQNLYYEQRHLLNEIGTCENYDHPHTLLPLVPESDFLASFPEHESSTPHDLMIARIQHEHSEREKLESERQELLKKKQSLIAENKKRKEDLANLDTELETFIDAAKPIVKRFEKEY